MWRPAPVPGRAECASKHATLQSDLGRASRSGLLPRSALPAGEDRGRVCGAGVAGAGVSGAGVSRAGVAGAGALPGRGRGGSLATPRGRPGEEAGPLRPLPGWAAWEPWEPLEPAGSSRATGKRVFSRRQFQETLQLVSLASWGRVWLASHRLPPSLSSATARRGKCACQDAGWGAGAPWARARGVGLAPGPPTELPKAVPSVILPPEGPPCPPAGGPGAPSQGRLRH